MDKKEIKTFAATLGISEIGVSKAEFLTELYTILTDQREIYGACPFEEESVERRCNPVQLLEGAKSIITCLFPYYSPKLHPVNLSRYACIKDYHHVAREKLHAIAEYISRQCGGKSVCFTDNGPLCDRYLAQRSGLGFYGKNHMLINERFGSYFFIGSLITTVELETDEPCRQSCMDCGQCLRFCPGGALSVNGFNYKRCISYLTQAKDLTEEQKELLNSRETAYGCDVCQEVCPHNQGIDESIMKEFAEKTLESLPKEILTMSNREFRKVYRDYPFVWCGRKTIARNLQKKT